MPRAHRVVLGLLVAALAVLLSGGCRFGPCSGPACPGDTVALPSAEGYGAVLWVDNDSVYVVAKGGSGSDTLWRVQAGRAPARIDTVGVCGEIQTINDLVGVDGGIALSVRCPQEPRDRILLLSTPANQYTTYAPLPRPGVAISRPGADGRLFVGQEAGNCFGVVQVGTDGHPPAPVVIQTPGGPLDLAAATANVETCQEYVGARWPMSASKGDAFAFLVTTNGSGDPVPSRQSGRYGLVVTTGRAAAAAKASLTFAQPRAAAMSPSGKLLAVSDLGPSPGIHLINVPGMVERTRFAGRYVSLSFSQDEHRIATIEMLDDGAERLRLIRV